MGYHGVPWGTMGYDSTRAQLEQPRRARRAGDIYLLPSLREGVPLTQMEAMAAGCIPVVMDCGGAGPMARAGGCDPIASSSEEMIVESIAATIVEFWNAPETMTIRSAASIAAVTCEYSSGFYFGKILRFYDDVAKYRQA